MNDSLIIDLQGLSLAMQRFCERAHIGSRVRYIPGHAHDDITHPDCEDGVIRALGTVCVGVVFDATVERVGHGNAPCVACDPLTLHLLDTPHSP